MGFLCSTSDKYDYIIQVCVLWVILNGVEELSLLPVLR